ncbi:putative High mobility group, HMG1/HMG2, High mobility group, superfamily protein [Pseudoloma neurophilia]|uniref:Putative High mobility group, HMG1/HMG2, High mobility group, superfamily protein n=1 Tax=Pseudoloma neurophilia TaxID=146866 RepID=A0A0R0M2C8_9MICR|nr:putative High mobility group, HMG1/HMG2, High mobility group, superfamily protein [Pseudoloma neurophilia]
MCAAVTKTKEKASKDVQVTNKETKKTKKLANAPKKPPTAYLSFSSFLRKSEPELFKGKSIAEQREILKEQWAELSEDEKDKYESEYKLLKEKYDKENEEYKNSPQYIIDCKEAGVKIKRKRPKSAYNLFVSMEYQKMEGTFAECTQQLSAKWKSMSNKEKEKYIKLSEEEKRQFKENSEGLNEE